MRREEHRVLRVLAELGHQGTSIDVANRIVSDDHVLDRQEIGAIKRQVAGILRENVGVVEVVGKMEQPNGIDRKIYRLTCPELVMMSAIQATAHMRTW